MTTAELQQVRAALGDAYEFGSSVAHVYPNDLKVWGNHWPEGWNKALAILDAELANPEAREWRVLAEDHSQCFWSEAEANAAADWLRTNDLGNVYVDSRTVGPWERAE